MRKRKAKTFEHITDWEGSTYHTGSAKPPKQGNALVAVLLVAVICLGGLASAFGVVNFRLLEMMAQQGDPVTPLDTNAATQTTHTNAFLENHDHPVPSLPADRQADLQLSNVPPHMTAEEIYARNEQSLVSVYCVTYSGGTVSGTGIVLSEDGYIVTNAHILEAARRIFVYLPDGRLERAALVGSDPFTDLAVLYVCCQELQPALFASASNLRAEDEVHALKDQPDSDRNFLLSGHVYALKEANTGDLTVQVLQSSLWGYNGPVFDSNGHIVAIRAGKIGQYFGSNLSTEKGIAIPSETILQVASQLIRHGHMEGRPTLRIQVETISKLYQHYWELPGGLIVTDIADGSSAQLQGLQAGDILLALDGVQMTCRADLYATVFQTEIGDELIAAVFRDGRKFTITLTVEEMVG